MKWNKNRKEHSITVQEALTANEGRLPEMMDDMFELAMDLKASRKERLEALKFLVEKAAPKNATESQTQGLIYTADQYAIMSHKIDTVMTLESQILKEIWTPEVLAANPTKPVMYVSPDEYKVFDTDGKVIASGD